jgi:hypothetical protein
MEYGVRRLAAAFLLATYARPEKREQAPALQNRTKMEFVTLWSAAACRRFQLTPDPKSGSKLPHSKIHVKNKPALMAGLNCFKG